MPKRATPAEIQRRLRIQQREFDRAIKKFSTLGEREAQRRAKIAAGVRATRITGKTRDETFGGQDALILIDTEALLESVSPGHMSGQEYSPNTSDQIMEFSAGELEIGTSIHYASKHQRGDESRNLPARPFLPDEEHTVPDNWWREWLEAGVEEALPQIARLFG